METICKTLEQVAVVRTYQERYLSAQQNHTNSAQEVDAAAVAFRTAQDELNRVCRAEGGHLVANGICVHCGLGREFLDEGCKRVSKDDEWKQYTQQHADTMSELAKRDTELTALISASDKERSSIREQLKVQQNSLAVICIRIFTQHTPFNAPDGYERCIRCFCRTSK